MYLSTLHDKKKRYIRIPENLYNNTLVCYLDPEGLVELGFTYNPIAGRETLSIIPLKFEDSLNPGVRKVASSICSSSSSSSSSSTSHAPAVRAERNWRADSSANCGQFILLATLTDHRKQVGHFNRALFMSERCLLGGECATCCYRGPCVHCLSTWIYNFFSIHPRIPRGAPRTRCLYCHPHFRLVGFDLTRPCRRARGVAFRHNLDSGKATLPHIRTDPWQPSIHQNPSLQAASSYVSRTSLY